MRTLMWLLLFSFVLVGCGASVKPLVGTAKEQMLQVNGDQVVNGSGTPVWLKGVAFGNRVWMNDPVPSTHHSEADFQRLADMGMNTVRFYLHYMTFESDNEPGQYKERGFEWLDKNIAWAKKHGIYLVLNMHVPPGGYQSNNGGKALWEDDSKKDRLLKLWQAIAERYKEEPTIAGYDLLNEPVVSQSHEQWHELAAHLIKGIRKVDPYHIIFIERVNAVDGDWKENEVRNMFLVDDPNVVYEFHFYKPFHFTHQSASWVEFVAKSTTWPDPNRVGIEWFLLDHKASTNENPTLPVGDSDWTYYEGKPFTITDPDIALGRPVLACDNNSGTAWFDDVVIEKVETDGSATPIWSHNPDTDRGWFFNDPGGKGNYGLDRVGHGDSTSLKIERTNGEANMAADIYMFRTESGATYRISGWMKGKEIPQSAVCRLRIDFQKANAPIHGWDKAFLEQELNTYLEFGRKHHVPLFLGEWGTISSSFQEDRGGIKWVEDMLSLIKKYNLHFTYHDYHESNFGIYGGDNTLPDPNVSNGPLIDLFKNTLLNL